MWKDGQAGRGHQPGSRPGAAGRPGWHIECSAMAERYLGPEFALHGGGRDLIFPHHENEVAQSHAAGRPFALVWVHNGMLQPVRREDVEVARQHRAAARRARRVGARDLSAVHAAGPLLCPIDYTDDALEQAQAAAETLRNRLREATGGEEPRCGRNLAGAGRRLQHAARAGAPVRCAAARPGAGAEVLDVLGLGVLGRGGPGAGGAGGEGPAERERARQARDFARPTRCATRWSGRLGGPRHGRGDARSTAAWRS